MTGTGVAVQPVGRLDSSNLRSKEQANVATEVRCTISDCQYWARGNFCASSSILITHGEPVLKRVGKPAHRRGWSSPQIVETPIRDIRDSYCRTFIRKGS